MPSPPTFPLSTVLLVPTCTYMTILPSTCSIPFVQYILAKTKRTYLLVSPSLTKRRRRDSNSSTFKIIAFFKDCFWQGCPWQVGYESFCRYAVFVGEVSERCRNSPPHFKYQILLFRNNSISAFLNILCF